jgi:pilus assembly protein CpaF
MTSDETDQQLVDAVCARVADAPGEPTELVAAELRHLAPLCSPDHRGELYERAVAQLVGLGELDRFLRDHDVDDVLVTADTEVWVDRRGRLEHVASLPPGRAVQLVERAIAPLGRRLDRSSPIVDARLPGGERLCAVLQPVAVDGTTVAIRKQRDHGVPLQAFADPAGERLLRDLVEQRCNVVVSGATAAGKTTLLAALLDTCDDRDRIVVVEDTAELVVHRPHAVRLEARPPSVDGPAPVDLADLVRTALRLRPDRIVVGEVRGDESLALVQAMNTGHDGSWSTCHANGPLDALWRLESLVLQAAPTWPLAAIRAQLARSIDVVVHVERTAGRRRVQSIAEVVAAPGGAEPQVVTLAESTGTGLVVRGHLSRGRRS